MIPSCATRWLLCTAGFLMGLAWNRSSFLGPSKKQQGTAGYEFHSVVHEEISPFVVLAGPVIQWRHPVVQSEQHHGMALSQSGFLKPWTPETMCSNTNVTCPDIGLHIKETQGGLRWFVVRYVKSSFSSSVLSCYRHFGLKNSLLGGTISCSLWDV